MSRKRRRLFFLVMIVALLGGATGLAALALRSNLEFFKSPSELASQSGLTGQRIRIGGVVEQRSLVHQADGQAVRFRVTDGQTNVAVVYKGALPDLFREGQGVVAEGRLGRDGVFVASSVLAKHDEKYMPPEVAEALKKAGRWQEGKIPAGHPLQLPPGKPLALPVSK
jgi:cytochrome c-type biogenesis protein CcmE